MQEDQLLSGSIADNICFFDPEFDQERMTRCAGLAGKEMDRLHATQSSPDARAAAPTH